MGLCHEILNILLYDDSFCATDSQIKYDFQIDILSFLKVDSTVVGKNLNSLKEEM